VSTPSAPAAEQSSRPPTTLAPGPVRLQVVFTPPPGRALDERYGASTQLTVTASPPGLLHSGAGTSADLNRTLVLADDLAAGVLHVSAQAATCDAGTSEHPACYLARQDWGVPVSVAARGEPRLDLILLG
jgi:hypothetical protein